MSHAEPISISMCVMPSRARRRDLSPGYESWDEKARGAYDDRTLFYDIFHAAQPNTVATIYAIGPTLRPNFRRLLKSANFQLDGIRASVVEISQTKRACILEIKAPVFHPTVLTISHPEISFSCAISESHLSVYEGLRSMFTLTRNNDLKWIRDWARYHVDSHGVEAVILFDNGSDKYSCNALCQTLSDVPRLKAFDVVPMPFEYGPTGKTRDRTNARFLQFGVFEIARLRFLEKSAGVLNADIDELVYGPANHSVFNALCQQESGFLTLHGQWRYSVASGPIDHSSHFMESGADEEQIYPKWCLRPEGPQQGKSWRTHGIKNLPNQEVGGFGFYHCRHISDSWSYDRHSPAEHLLEIDEQAKSRLAILRNE